MATLVSVSFVRASRLLRALTDFRPWPALLLLCGWMAGATPTRAAQSPVLLPLADALATALDQNGKILTACTDIEGARSALDVAEADYGVKLTPSITSGLGTDTQTSQSAVAALSKKFSTGTTVELSAGSSVSDNDFYRSFTGVTVSQSVLGALSPSLNTSQLATAEQRIASAQRKAAGAADEVVLEVISTYYEIVGGKLVVNLYSRSLDRAQRLLAAADLKLSKGLATRMEVLSAESQLAEAESNHLEAEQALSESKEKLNLLMGRSAASAYEVQEELIRVPVNFSEEDLVETALASRRDLADLTGRVDDARRQVDAAEWQIWPDLRLGLNYSFTGTGDSFEQSTNFDDSGVRVLFSTSIPVTGAAAQAKLGDARRELERRVRDTQDARRDLDSEVRRALRRVWNIERRITIQEKNAASTRAALDLANMRFERGYSDALEVLQAEDRLMQAQKGEIDLRIERLRAALEVRRSAGVLAPVTEEILGNRYRADPCPLLTAGRADEP